MNIPQPMEKGCQYIFKIILIGDSGVGKTSLMNRYKDNTYESGNAATIGVDFVIKNITIGDKKVKLQIWDTAGQERFRAIVSNYYRGANGILIVFDTLNKESFIHLKDWIEELKKQILLKSAEIRILGNKIDDKEKVCISKDEVQKFLLENGIPPTNYYEVSAKDDINVEESFVELTKKLIDVTGVSNAKQAKKPTFIPQKTQGGGCC